MNKIGLRALVVGGGLAVGVSGCCKKILQYDYEHPPLVVEKSYEPAREYTWRGERQEGMQDILFDDEDYILSLLR